MKTYFSQISVEAVAASAELRLARTRKYRDPTQREASIAAVRMAVTPYNTIGPSPDLSAPVTPSENPILRLAPVSRGFANGFLVGWQIRAPSLLVVIDKHGLFNAGLAALSLVTPTDNQEAIMVLQSLMETWRDGRSAAPRKGNAQESRSPFVALVRQVRAFHPEATAKEMWNHLTGVKEVDFKGSAQEIDVKECPDGSRLEWYSNVNGTEVSGTRKWEGFDRFLSRVAPKKSC